MFIENIQAIFFKYVLFLNPNFLPQIVHDFLPISENGYVEKDMSLFSLL